MKLSEAGAAPVWLPLTPGGVAHLAFAPLWRLVVIQWLFAAAGALAVALFLAASWFPVVRESIAALPNTGAVRGGRLDWPGASSEPLADNGWLALIVDLQHSQSHRFPSDLQVEFGREDVRLLTFAGYVDLPYPRHYSIAFNRMELEPWWNAREPFLAAGAGVLSALAATTAWTLLALLYAVPGMALGRFVTRGLPFSAAWKLCSASQMPGGLATAAGVLLYSLPVIDLVTLLFIFAVQFAAGWVYFFLALFFLPARAPGAKGRAVNPFQN